MVPLQPGPHGRSGLLLIDAKVVKLVVHCDHSLVGTLFDSLWVSTHNVVMARVSQAKKEEHRRRLLAAAADEFAKHGIAGARVDDISLAAGLGKGTVYNYFESKEQIFQAVVEAWSVRATAQADSVPSDASIAAKLTALVEAELAATLEMESFARAAYLEVMSAGFRGQESPLPTYDPIGERALEVLGEAQTLGELRVDHSVDDMVRILFSLVTGTLLDHWFRGNSMDPSTAASVIVECFLHGVAPR